MKPKQGYLKQGGTLRINLILLLYENIGDLDQKIR
jgi:hypothetical protein